MPVKKPKYNISYISQLFHYKSSIKQLMKKNRIRQIGTISKYDHLIEPVPRSIMDMTINNINMYKQMKGINSNSCNVFDKYQQIIRDLQQVIQNLQEKHAFMREQRLRLLKQNARLQQQIQSLKQNCIMTDSYIRKQQPIFETVTDQQQQSTIPHSLVRMHKKDTQILQQQQFDVTPKQNVHYFCDLIAPQLQISEECISQQKTPCLNNIKNPSTLIQCRSTNNQAPLRIFYLLLLQYQQFIQKIRELLKFCIQDQSKILLHLLPNHNTLWAQILDKFLDLVVKGQFENQIQVIQYISQNCLIDILLVSVLKHSLPVENQDNQLNIGDWKNQDIDHGVLLQGLCNQFDLAFQQDKDHSIFKIYINNNLYEKQPSEALSEQMLLESRQKLKQIDVSLLPKNVYFNSCSQSQVQPLFKIWKDPHKQFYRANISIRPQKINLESQYDENESFHQTEKSESRNQDESLFIPELQQSNRKPLIPRDLNCIEGLKKYPQEDYLKPKTQSMSMNHSYIREGKN